MSFPAVLRLLFCILVLSPPLSAQLIVAHRGASHDAPENTLSAFKLAWKKGADAIEGDFYLTKDGQIACLHDKTTKRLAPGQPVKVVAESTLAELQTLDVGSWKHPKFAGERIPTLQQVLKTVPPGKQIFVEIKTGPEILPELKRQLAESRLQDNQITIICFNQEVVTLARQQMSQYTVNWLTSYKQNKQTGHWKPTAAEVVSTLQRTHASGLGSHGNTKVVDDQFVAAVRNAGAGFHVWTINEPAEAIRFRDLGVDSITTDRPAFIRRALQPLPGQTSQTE